MTYKIHFHPQYFPFCSPLFPSSFWSSIAIFIVVIVHDQCLYCRFCPTQPCRYLCLQPLFLSCPPLSLSLFLSMNTVSVIVFVHDNCFSRCLRLRHRLRRRFCLQAPSPSSLLFTITVSVVVFVPRYHTPLYFLPFYWREREMWKMNVRKK